MSKWLYAVFILLLIFKSQYILWYKPLYVKICILTEIHHWVQKCPQKIRWWTHENGKVWVAYGHSSNCPPAEDIVTSLLVPKVPPKNPRWTHSKKIFMKRFGLPTAVPLIVFLREALRNGKVWVSYGHPSFCAPAGGIITSLLGPKVPWKIRAGRKNIWGMKKVWVSYGHPFLWAPAGGYEGIFGH